LQHASRRYAHSAAYVRRLTEMYGFEERSLAPIEARVDAGRPVKGYLAVLRLASVPT
jgi:predicted TPR repeat methyltransferase